MKAVQANHEHEFEAAHGLPEPLPAGERILWQGAPDWRVLARNAFHVRKLVLYFGLILTARAAFVHAETASAADTVKAVVMLAPLVALCIGLMLFMAWLTARTTVYTLTDRRIVMRVGIVLSPTFNLPLKRIESAGLHLEASGHGDIPLVLKAPDLIAYLHLWPHARPWRVKRPEPMLRCIPDAQRVARLVSDAWTAVNGASAVQAPVAGPAPERARTAGDRQAVLAGR